MTEYTTNPNKRCKLCEGREVITIEDNGTTTTSLQVIEGEYYCIDREECGRNIEAEGTTIDFFTNGKIEICKFGKPIIELEDARWNLDTKSETE